MADHTDMSQPTPDARPPSAGRFVAIEDSGPSGETGLGQLTVVSPALNGRGDITYWVPPQSFSGTNLPVVVLLHGVYGSHWAWTAKAQAHRTAQRLIESQQIAPCILAMPSDGLCGEGSGYINGPDGTPQYEDWVADDVPDALTHALPQVGRASMFYLSGLSMGGFGALRVGSRRCDRFAAFSGMSSLTHLKQMAWCTHHAKRFCDLPDETACLLETLTQSPSHRPFRFDCGTDDYLIEENRALHHSLLERGIAHIYQEFPGDHSWDYWHDHLADTLLFFHHTQGPQHGAQ